MGLPKRRHSKTRGRKRRTHYKLGKAGCSYKGKTMPSVLVVVIGYLLGSIPSAYIMARIRKSGDIRYLGVGNMGAANVLRHVGIWEGIVVGLTDIAKGAAAILIARALNVPQLWLLSPPSSHLWQVWLPRPLCPSS